MATKSTTPQIADMSGVSIVTVSRSINNTTVAKDSTAKKIMEVIHSLNYPSSESLITTNTRKDGKVVLINVSSVSNSFYNDAIKGTQDAALRHDYYILVDVQHLNSSTESTSPSLLDNINFYGATILNAVDQGCFNSLYHTIPFVQCCEYTENQDLVSYTSADDMAAVKTMTEYILFTGHIKIAPLYGPDRYEYACQRRAGYIQTLEAARTPPNKDWTTQLPKSDSDMALSSTYQLMSQKKHPTAVFAVSSVPAAAVVCGYRLVGLSVPSDIVITGFDNVNISQATSPPITTINQPKYQMSYIAYEPLIEKLDIPDTRPRQVLLSTELIIRKPIQRQRTQYQNIPNQGAYFGVKLGPEGRPTLAERP